MTMCSMCHAPADVVLGDSRCRDCTDLMNSPFNVSASHEPHGYVYAASSGGNCWRCGRQEVAPLHAGHPRGMAPSTTCFQQAEDTTQPTGATT